MLFKISNVFLPSPLFDIIWHINTSIILISEAPPTIWRFLPLLDPQVEVTFDCIPTSHLVESFTSIYPNHNQISQQQLQVAIVRDLDSRLSAREASAVAQWLDIAKKQGLFLHVMRSISSIVSIYLWSIVCHLEEICLRDHPHHSAPMLAGMWGSVRVANEEFDRFQENMRHLFGEVCFFLKCQYLYSLPKQLFQANGFEKNDSLEDQVFNWHEVMKFSI